MTCVESPRAIQVVREGFSNHKNHASMAALGAVTCSLFGGVACAHGVGLVGLQWSFFFSFFSIFYLMPLKFASNLPNNNCVLRFVVLLILALLFLLLFIQFLMLFEVQLFFNFFPDHFIQFDFFYLIQSLYFLLLYFCILYFS